MNTVPEFYSKLARESHWFSEAELRSNRIAEEWLVWLQDRGSLTKSLMAVSSKSFHVRVLSERWSRPLRREAHTLNIEMHIAVRVREVELVCDDQVMVYARSIIPLDLFEQEPFTFQGMGSKPLGHLLFKDGKARNRQRSVSSFIGSDGRVTYGRATPYEYHQGVILVSEFFVNQNLILLQSSRSEG